MKVIEFDVVFLSYDEPNADLHYADLCTKVPWAKRVHGVKGSDHAHKAAAELSETDWFITVDADNIVDPKFFNIDLDMSDPKIKVYGWCGNNRINGLRYGNGGLKIWNKEFVLNMNTSITLKRTRPCLSPSSSSCARLGISSTAPEARASPSLLSRYLVRT